MTQSVMSMATKKAAAAQVRPSLTGGAPVRDSFDSPSWALSHFSLLVPKLLSGFVSVLPQMASKVLPST
eukprot:CAMPEP_0197504792 /NCGR_PEP_ID=MMETSP1312-20131121/3751_1 /TAXON_ID=464262 /ORGANISM="Genus nov. species nov., Strain RCC2335" /LENGTH=68 /DNA_ID=CAMNT_0043051687 /DNA_START=72 /DNA_END=278 /DNA_ORIENTATION=-